MPNKIRFAKLTITLYMPVCSRTAEEAIEIAKDCVDDFVSGYDALPVPDVELYDEQPELVDDDDTVWGEAVPEETMTVAELRDHLGARNK